MKPQRTQLSFRLKHPTRDLSSVCDTLGMHPAHLWTVGDRRQTPKGTVLGGLRTESYCSIDLGSTKRKYLSEQIEAALVQLKPHRRLLRRLSSTGGRISFFVGWFCDKHTGDSFDCQLLDQMADLRIGLELNVYVPDAP